MERVEEAVEEWRGAAGRGRFSFSGRLTRATALMIALQAKHKVARAVRAPAADLVVRTYTYTHRVHLVDRSS